MLKIQKWYKIIWCIAGLFVVAICIFGAYFLLQPVQRVDGKMMPATSSSTSASLQSSSSAAKNSTESASSRSGSESTTENSAPQTTGAKDPVAQAPTQNAVLANYLSSFQSEPVGIFVRSFDEDMSYGVNAETLFYGASVAKLPIILYTIEALKTGRISPETSFPYTKVVNTISGAMIAGGTGSLQYEAYAGRAFSVEDLLSRTIEESDNQASNMLSYYVGEQNGADFMEAIQPFYTFRQDQFFKNMNATTAGNLMQAIYQNGRANAFFTQTDWQTANIGSLPYTVLHKIGINGAFNHDVGIVLAPQPYVVAILTNGYSDEQIAAIAARIDELMK